MTISSWNEKKKTVLFRETKIHTRNRSKLYHIWFILPILIYHYLQKERGNPFLYINFLFLHYQQF